MPKRSTIIEKRAYLMDDGTSTRSPYGDGGNAAAVRYSLTDGTELTFSLEDVSEGVLHALAAHGLNQKLGDLQSAEDVDSPEAFAEAAKVVWENLTADEPVWSARGGDGGPSQEVRDTARAYAELSGTDPETALAIVTGEQPDGKGEIWAWETTEKGNPKQPARYRAFRKLPPVKEKLADYAKERAQKGSGGDVGDFF